MRHDDPELDKNPSEKWARQLNNWSNEDNTRASILNYTYICINVWYTYQICIWSDGRLSAEWSLKFEAIITLAREFEARITSSTLHMNTEHVRILYVNIINISLEYVCISTESIESFSSEIRQQYRQHTTHFKIHLLICVQIDEA